MQIMKINNERSFHSNGFHELLSNGGPKVDSEVERDNLLAEKMVEQTNPSEHSFVKAEDQDGGKTRFIRIDDVSYDKDVVEIKLTDTVVSSDYGGHFVKDVCIDEGVLADQKASEDSAVGEKMSLDFDSSMGDSDTIAEPVEETISNLVKSGHGLKSIVVNLPVTCASDDNTMEQHFSPKVHDLEGNDTMDDLGNLDSEKLSPKQLVSDDSAKQSQQACTIISETSADLGPFLDADAIDQVSSKDHGEIGASIAPETSNLNDLPPVESTSNGLSAVMLEEGVVGTATGLHEVNHYNPFVVYVSLDDTTWESKYSVPTIANAAFAASICPVEKTDSFSDLVNGGVLGDFDFVETDESIIKDSVRANSSRLGVQASEESNNQRGSLVEKTDSFSDLISAAPGGSDSIQADETRTKHSRLHSIEESSGRLDVQAPEESNDHRDDHMAHGTGTSSAEPSGAESNNHRKFEIDNGQDVHDFNPRIMEDATSIRHDHTGSKSHTLEHTEPVDQQNEPDSAKMTAWSGMRNPFEASFSGSPSITSDVLSPSSHIGNVSLRSDSSTTSTRSFAFPVLQNEWNSSPVKMVKADRKSFRRDRSWGYRILCCKF